VRLCFCLGFRGMLCVRQAAVWRAMGRHGEVWTFSVCRFFSVRLATFFLVGFCEENNFRVRWRVVRVRFGVARQGKVRCGYLLCGTVR
jgi:hypothetical protein